MPMSLAESPDAARAPGRPRTRGPASPGAGAAPRAPKTQGPGPRCSGGEQASPGERESPLMARLGDRPIDVNRMQETSKVSLFVHQLVLSPISLRAAETSDAVIGLSTGAGAATPPAIARTHAGGGGR